MATEFDDLSEYEQIHLRMEDVIEDRIQIDKENCADLDADWEDFYDGECESCGRVYEAHYLVTVDYRTDPHEFPPKKGDCIPCWRKKHDLPKIDHTVEN